MLLRPHSSVEISGGFDTTSFTIVDSQNSFALLQGKQYEDPINATLRALVENALDTQTEAGVSTPIELNFGRETIQVTDKGMGISPEVFANNFTKFFASNRTASNAYHGFFGVGAKAPLSVATKFKVTTVHGGLEYVWECRRGQPTPTAQMLSSHPTKKSTGTTVELLTQDMSHWHNDTNLWRRRAQDLMNSMPTKIKGVASHLDSSRSSLGPELLIGGMPYPLPSAKTLGLPEHIYTGQLLKIPVGTTESATADAPPEYRGKKFGTRPARTTKKPPEIQFEERAHKVRVTMDIGDLDIHFSKERVATTNSNIEKLREATLKQWYKQQWEMANEFSAHPQAKEIDWRMPMDVAKVLATQGHATHVLAWATRPKCLEGPCTALNAATPLTLLQASANSKSTTEHKNWIARVELHTQFKEIEAWAAEWSQPIQWSKIPQTNNCLEASVVNYDGVDRLPLYTSTLEALYEKQLKRKEDIIILTLDAEWYNLDASLREHLSQWWELHARANFIFTPLTLAEAQVVVPTAKSFRESCREKMTTLLANVPENILGDKTICLEYDGGRNASKWLKSMVPPEAILNSTNTRASLEAFPAMLAWLDMPAVECTTLDRLYEQHLAKMPILRLLPNSLGSADTQHLIELLSP